LQIINLSEKNQKPLIIIINKSDIIKEKEKIEDELRRRLKSLSFCPIIYISALKSRKIRELIKLTDEILISSKLSFGKKELNLAISKMSKKNSPNFWNGGKLKIYYAKHEVGMTQKFIVFVNNVNFLHFSYQRYVSNFFRREFNIKYNPIKVFFKNST
jgi:GTP-binding protein